MADIIYLTLNGNKQGLISAGCSSYDSIGNRYQNNHSDEILVYSTDYDISRHQNISHAPFVFEKADDKSSALLLSSITNNEILECDFKYYRIDKNGGLLHYIVYLIVITPVFVFLNGKMNSLYKCLFYFIFPYFLSLFAWYTHIYFDLPKNSNLGSGTLLGEFGYITVTIYIIYGSFLIPLIACLCEIFIRLLYRYLYRFY